MLAELIFEIIGAAAEELIGDPKIPKAVRIVIASAILIPLTVFVIMLAVSADIDSIAGRLIIGAVAAVILLLYLAALRKMIRS